MQKLLAGLLAVAGMATVSGRTRAAELKTGDAAPTFKLQGYVVSGLTQASADHGGGVLATISFD